MRVSRLLPALVVLAIFALPAVASASTLTRSSGVYTYTGSASDQTVNINFGDNSFSVSDTENITMAADASCTGEGTQNISCSVTPTSISADTQGGNDGLNIQNSGYSGAPFPLSAQTGTGNDNATITSAFTSGAPSTATLNDTSGNDTLTMNVGVNVTSTGYGTVDGGIGDDTVTGTATVNGGDGNDILRGQQGFSSGSPTLNGGNNDDTFTLDNGGSTVNNEIVNGGSGSDTVDYSQAANVNVSLDSVKNDGSTNGSQDDNANADGSVEIVRTGETNDTVTGGPGNDTIFAGGGRDTINGSGGDDLIDAGLGGDVINGGANGAAGDTIDYSTRGNPLRVSPDGLAANDGEANELDNVGSDVENVIGGFDNDSIGGNPSNNNFNGGLGEDSFDGAGGNDTLIGGSGDDNLDGAANNDTITGGPGDDTIDGGTDVDTVSGDSGADLVDGGSGVDTINGNDGSDTLLSKDGGADTVNCGNSTDHAVHDVAGDTVNADCEISDTGAAGFGVGSGVFGNVTGGSSSKAVMTCDTKRFKASGRVRSKCTVALLDGSNALVRAKLVRKGKTVASTKRRGSGSFTLRTAKHARKGVYRVVVKRGGKVIAKAKAKFK